MAGQRYIVDMKALYECLQFLPQMRVNGEPMVSLESILTFLDYFPKEPVNVVSSIVLDEDPFEAPEPLEHPCDNCEIQKCPNNCEKLAEFWKQAKEY